MLELAGELMGDYDSEESEGERQRDNDEEDDASKKEEEREDGERRGNGRRNGPRNGRHEESRGESRRRPGFGRIVMGFRGGRDRDEEIERARREQEREEREQLREAEENDSWDDEREHDRMAECFAEAVQMAKSFKRAYENGNTGERKRLNDRCSESEMDEGASGDASSSMDGKPDERSFPRAPTADGEDIDSLDSCHESNGNDVKTALKFDSKRAMDNGNAENASEDTDSSVKDKTKKDRGDKMDDSDTESENSIASSSSGLSDDGIFDHLTFKKKSSAPKKETPKAPPEPNYLRMRVEQLPLPQSLVSYLLYYREI